MGSEIFQKLKRKRIFNLHDVCFYWAGDCPPAGWSHSKFMSKEGVHGYAEIMRALLASLARYDQADILKENYPDIAHKLFGSSILCEIMDQLQWWVTIRLAKPYKLKGYDMDGTGQVHVSHDKAPVKLKLDQTSPAKELKPGETVTLNFRGIQAFLRDGLIAEVTDPAKKSRIKKVGDKYFDIVEQSINIDPELGHFEVSRDALIDLAERLEEKPEFLFPPETRSNKIVGKGQRAEDVSENDLYQDKYKSECRDIFLEYKRQGKSRPPFKEAHAMIVEKIGDEGEAERKTVYQKWQTKVAYELKMISPRGRKKKMKPGPKPKK